MILRRIFTALLAAATISTSAAGIAQAEPNTFVGVTLTSNYVTGGYSSSDEKPALQGYVERTFRNGLYVGLWGSTLTFGSDEDSYEFDLYAGYRGSMGKLNYDLTYYRYVYDDTGDCCEEVWVSLSYPVAEPLTVGFLYRDDLEGFVRYRPFFSYDLGNGFGLGGLLQKADGYDGIYGKLEISKKLEDGITIAAAWHDRSDDDEIIELKISFATAFGG